MNLVYLDQKEKQSEKNISLLNGYELRIQLLQKELINKNVKILQITANRKEMLKQQISSYFESIEQYLKLIVQNTQDKSFPQYVKRFLQLTRSLHYKKSWFVEEKNTMNYAIQTQLCDEILDNKQQTRLSVQKNQQIVSAFELTHIYNQQQNDFQTQNQNIQNNDKNRSKTLPYLGKNISYKKQTADDKNSLEKQYIKDEQVRKKQQNEELIQRSQKIMLQNQQLKQLLKKAWMQINLLNNKNSLIYAQQNQLQTNRGQDNFKTHRIKYSQGSIKHMKQIQKNSQLISSDIYNLSQTPLLSKENNYKRIGKQVIHHQEIKKHLFNKKGTTELNEAQNCNLPMILLCQASSIQKLLSCIK